jgi:hypothetical protein
MHPNVSPNANQTPRFAWLQVQRGDLDMNFVVLLFKRMEIVYFRNRCSLIILKEVVLPFPSSISSLQRLRRLLKSSLNMRLVSTSKTKMFVFSENVSL